MKIIITISILLFSLTLFPLTAIGAENEEIAKDFNPKKMKKNKILTKVLVALIIIICFCGCDNSSVYDSTSEVLADYPSYSNATELLQSSNLVIEGELIKAKNDEIDLRTEKSKEDGVPLTYFNSAIYTIKITKIYKQTEVESDYTRLKEADEIYKKATVNLLEGDVIKAYQMGDGYKWLENGKKYFFIFTTAPDSPYYMFINDSQAVYSTDSNAEENIYMIPLESVLNELGK